MSQVDLSKAKAGDTVHFRCGGKSKVKEIKKFLDAYLIMFNGYKVRDIYESNGIAGLNKKNLLDIVKVESK